MAAQTVKEESAVFMSYDDSCYEDGKSIQFAREKVYLTHRRISQRSFSIILSSSKVGRVSVVFLMAPFWQ